METASGMSQTIDKVIALFNTRSEDLPDGLFDRKTQFLLNGRPFEEMLGRSPNDPLVLMLTRGNAGYRFSAKAVQHAVPDGKIVRGEITEQPTRVTWQCWLSGHLRGTNEPLETVFDVEFQRSGAGPIERAMVTIDETALAKIRDARLRP